MLLLRGRAATAGAGCYYGGVLICLVQAATKTECFCCSAYGYHHGCVLLLLAHATTTGVCCYGWCMRLLWVPAATLGACCCFGDVLLVPGHAATNAVYGACGF